MTISTEDIIRRFEKAKSERANWEGFWQDVANLVLPTRDFTSVQSSGTQRTRQIFDGTAPDACESLAAAMHGLMTNPSIRWFSLCFQDNYDVDDDVKAWLYDTATRMIAYFGSAQSGFATASHEVYLDLCAFGTGVTLLHEKGGWLRFQARALSPFFIEENEAGQTVATYRRFDLKAREAAAEFGLSALSEKAQKLASDPKKSETPICILHCVWERDEYDPTRSSGQYKKWGSRYIELETKHTIGKEGGFDTSPYLTPRWGKAPQEVYGRSPSMQVLPSIKVINAMSKTVLQAGEIATRPPMYVPANGTEGPIRLTPGGLNYGRPGLNNKPEPMLTGSDPRIGRDMMMDVRGQIEKAFFLDDLRLPGPGPAGGQPRMTAEEVIQRRMQGLLFASPMLSRLYEEWLDPAVTAVYNWMRRTNRIADPPASVKGRAMKPHYESPLAQSQRASQAQGFTSAMVTANPLLVADPTALMNIDADAAVRQIFSWMNVDPKVLKKTSQVKAMRAQQAQQQQAAAQVSLAQGGAAAAKDAASGLKDLGGLNGAS